VVGFTLTGERGVWGGDGRLLKELLTEGVRCAVDPNLGLFDTTADGLLFARPAAERLDQVRTRQQQNSCSLKWG
jgi:hypothetical protein